ncbi:hypothetical protein BD414DRAFT_478628 [Trametes punicea]|nr:hypothetical protein BD414DRAFT_478628 [Trametes punicea]
MSRSVMCPPISHLTPQRYNVQFGVNVLGHFYLIELLLPALLYTARMTSRTVRVLNYTCAISRSCHIDYTTLMDAGVEEVFACLAVSTVEAAEQYGGLAGNPFNSDQPRYISLLPSRVSTLL